MSLGFEQFSAAVDRFKGLNMRVNDILVSLNLPYKNLLSFDHYGRMTLLGVAINDTILDSEIERIIATPNSYSVSITSAFFDPQDSLCQARLRDYCFDLLKTPFFHGFERAKALSISFAPTHEIVHDNFPHQLARNRISNLANEEIYDIIYDNAKNSFWRNNYDLIFSSLGIDIDDVFHFDSACILSDRLTLMHRFDQLELLIKQIAAIIEVLSDRLSFIIIDGNKNSRVLQKYLASDFSLKASSQLSLSAKKMPHEILIYKHNQSGLVMMCCDCYLYGRAELGLDNLLKIAQLIATYA